MKECGSFAREVHCPRGKKSLHILAKSIKIKKHIYTFLYFRLGFVILFHCFHCKTSRYTRNVHAATAAGSKHNELYKPYAMLCYAMLCYAMLCYAMLCYAMLWYGMVWYGMVCSDLNMFCMCIHLFHFIIHSLMYLNERVWQLRARGSLSTRQTVLQNLCKKQQS